MQRGAIGNILEYGYEAVWKGIVANSIREKVGDNLLPTACQTASCPYAHLTSEERLWHIVDVSNPHPFPTEIELDLPDSHCNVGGLSPNKKNPACLMCERHLYGTVQKDRVNEICAVIKPYIQYIDKFHIQGIAETFWKDKIFEVFDLLDMRSHKDRVFVSTTTNATILDQKRRVAFLEYPFSSLTFSLDAATASTFKLIRRWDMFEKVKENVKNYCQEKTPSQVAGIHNNLNLLNINEAEDMVVLAKELGVDFVDFNPTYGIPEICVNEQNVHLFAEAQSKIKEKAAEIEMKVSFMRDLTLGLNVPSEPKLIQITVDQVVDLAEKLWVDSEDLMAITDKNPDMVKVIGFKPFL